MRNTALRCWILLDHKIGPTQAKAYWLHFLSSYSLISSPTDVGLALADAALAQFKAAKGPLDRLRKRARFCHSESMVINKAQSSPRTEPIVLIDFFREGQP